MIKISNYTFLPTGQGWEVQACVTVSVLDALQFLPPLAGDGFEQVLVWVWFPFPQVTLQVLHEDQIDQFPSEIHIVAQNIGILWEITQITRNIKLYFLTHWTRLRWASLCYCFCVWSTAVFAPIGRWWIRTSSCLCLISITTSYTTRTPCRPNWPVSIWNP